MAKDYYDILGITKSASQDEIKAAFRKLAHQYHPDKSGGDEKKFKEINEAYQILSNPEKRQQYDQYGQTFEQAQAQGGFSGFNGFRDFSGFADAFRQNGGGRGFEFNFGDFGDILGDFFGRNSTGTGARQKRGSDLETEVAISFHESVFGVEKEIQINKNSRCDRCGGVGAEPGSKVIKCKNCGGKGQVVKNIGFGIGFSTVCSECKGIGERYDSVCGKCRGSGVIKEKKKLLVKIPAGIEDDQAIRLTGEGEAGIRGAKSGDLYIRVRVARDHKFTREDNDILSKEEISFKQSALGSEISVETIDGLAQLKIPAGTQSSTVFKLRGKGVPYLHGNGRGDHLVQVIVKTPTHLNSKQKRLLEEFDENR